MAVGMLLLLFLLGVLFLAVVMFVIGTYNRFVRLRNAVQNMWSQIDVQLRRRYDLIPNLVETVKGYAAHERETLENVTAARTRAMGAKTVKEQGEAEGMLTGALKTLFAVAEKYPDLKANENFLQLQGELNNTETQIASARQGYNNSVMQYKNARQQFPANVVASLFKFEERDFFEIGEGEAEAREPVQVKF
jgi:LemA protein